MTGDRLLARLLMLVIRAYQLVIRPVIGAHCRFAPHCSAYAIEALSSHGAFRGSALTAKRLLRCHPWHPGGIDPVPPCACQSTPRLSALTCGPDNG